MNPTHYTKHRTSSSIIYIFHYKFSDLRKFLTNGKKHGNNGFIITRWDGKYKKMRGFGTIENPSTTLIDFNFHHYREFGEFNPDHVINPPKQNHFINYKIIAPRDE